MDDKTSVNILGDIGTSINPDFRNLNFKTIETKANDPIWDLSYLTKTIENQSDSKHKFTIYGFKTDQDFELICLVSRKFKVPFYHFPLSEDVITLDILN